MAKYSARSSRHFVPSSRQSSGVDIRGMQSSELVIHPNHPAWDVLAGQSAPPVEEGRLASDSEVDMDALFLSEEDGDEAAHLAVGGTFLRLAQQRGIAFGNGLEEDPGR